MHKKIKKVLFFVFVLGLSISLFSCQQSAGNREVENVSFEEAAVSYSGYKSSSFGKWEFERDLLEDGTEARVVKSISGVNGGILFEDNKYYNVDKKELITITPEDTDETTPENEGEIKYNSSFIYQITSKEYIFYSLADGTVTKRFPLRDEEKNITYTYNLRKHKNSVTQFLDGFEHKIFTQVDGIKFEEAKLDNEKAVTVKKNSYSNYYSIKVGPNLYDQVKLDVSDTATARNFLLKNNNILFMVTDKVTAEEVDFEYQDAGSKYNIEYFLYNFKEKKVNKLELDNVFISAINFEFSTEKEIFFLALLVDTDSKKLSNFCYFKADAAFNNVKKVLLGNKFSSSLFCYKLENGNFVYDNSSFDEIYVLDKNGDLVKTYNKRNVTQWNDNVRYQILYNRYLVYLNSIAAISTYSEAALVIDLLEDKVILNQADHKGSTCNFLNGNEAVVSLAFKNKDDQYVMLSKNGLTPLNSKVELVIERGFVATKSDDGNYTIYDFEGRNVIETEFQPQRFCYESAVLSATDPLHTGSKTFILGLSYEEKYNDGGVEKTRTRTKFQFLKYNYVYNEEAK